MEDAADQFTWLWHAQEPKQWCCHADREYEARGSVWSRFKDLTDTPMEMSPRHLLKANSSRAGP